MESKNRLRFEDDVLYRGWYSWTRDGKWGPEFEVPIEATPRELRLTFNTSDSTEVHTVNRATLEMKSLTYDNYTYSNCEMTREKIEKQDNKF